MGAMTGSTDSKRPTVTVGAAEEALSRLGEPITTRWFVEVPSLSTAAGALPPEQVVL